MKKLLLAAMLFLMFSGVQTVQAEETYQDFFGQGSNNVDPSILNTQDEEDTGSLNQGWDGGTGEVVPGDADVNIPDASPPEPVETDE